jgi:plasmid replication initiation protein
MKINKSLEYKLNNYLVTEKSVGKQWISMSNALARAGHGLTLSEKRIVFAAMAKLDSYKPVYPGDVPVTKITALEYSEIFDVTLDTAYDQLQAASKVLYNRSIKFYEPAYGRKGKPIEPTTVHMRWVGSVHYHEGEGWVELHWWPKLVKHLTGLRRQFTSYQLQHANALRSVYSWKLLELLMHFKSSGWAEYSIEDFLISMDATEKYGSNFAKLRTKVIEPAVNELTEKAGWKIQWEAIKVGRKVRTIKFGFIPGSQESLLPSLNFTSDLLS